MSIYERQINEIPGPVECNLRLNPDRGGNARERKTEGTTRALYLAALPPAGRQFYFILFFKFTLSQQVALIPNKRRTQSIAYLVNEMYTQLHI